MQQLGINEIKDELASILSKYDIKEAILFGSHVKNKATIHSDIDLVVDTDITGFKFLKIENEISDLLDRAIDLIPKRCIAPDSTIAQSIANEGVVIYEA